MHVIFYFYHLFTLPQESQHSVLGYCSSINPCWAGGLSTRRLASCLGGSGVMSEFNVLHAKAGRDLGDGMVYWYYLVQAPRKRGENLRPEAYLTWYVCLLIPFIRAMSLNTFHRRLGSSIVIGEDDGILKIREFTQPEAGSGNIVYLDEVDFSHAAFAARGIKRVGHFTGDIVYLEPQRSSSSSRPVVDPSLYHYTMLLRLRVAIEGGYAQPSVNTDTLQLRVPLVVTPHQSHQKPLQWTKDEVACGIIGQVLIRSVFNR